MAQRADLHTHTVWSDGALTPRALMERARERLLHVLAICDHDTIAAYDSLRPGDIPMHLTLVPGMEVSAWLGDHEVHILALGMDLSHPRLRRTVANLGEHRVSRSGRIFDLLVRNGCFRSMDDDARAALRHTLTIRPDLNLPARAGTSDGVGAVACRVLIARALVASGDATSVRDAFNRWIGERRAAFVAGARYPAEEAISMIREAGGVPILAHPGAYRDFFKPSLRAAAAAGIAGYELEHPKHTGHQKAVIRDIAREEGLTLLTGGSDYHSDASHHAARFGRSFSPEDHLDALFDQMRVRSFIPRPPQPVGSPA